MKTCAYCGRENQDQATACIACGGTEFRTTGASKADPYLISVLPWYRRAHRKRLLAEPFPQDWESLLQRNVAHYPLLNSEHQSRLKADLRILVTEKNWEGCDGLEMTDEIKVTVAAEAALMLLGLKHDYFSQMLSIVVFPTEFEMLCEDWQDPKEQHFASGQAFYCGPVLLSWDRVLAEARDPSSGRNLVIHEFAHQLDFLDGQINGVPVLRDGPQTARWSRIMTEQFDRLRQELDEGHGDFLGDYAGSHPTEFFSTVSERFFTVPAQLRSYDAGLYNVLLEYYAIDPIPWFGPSPATNN